MEHILIPLAGISLPLFLVPTIMLLKQGHQKRQWRHLERMQAIAAGTPVPPAISPPGTGAVIAIGAGVPVFASFCALVATMNMGHYMPDSLAQTAITWGCALVVSMGAMTTSLVLFVLQHRAHAKAMSAALSSYSEAHFDSSKPAYDPDSFDVVSRRG
ncbi:hypothetical protein [Paludisphaera borealis]|uniref:hypothetical protein n=1 Tax=Paludisphaera borealis TaxID=1387353 RepID=UPI000970C0D9|nr:hypothetical protein [Paludisphaera borealis]